MRRRGKAISLRLPYMNIFGYMSGEVYAVDFYYPVDAPDYADLFRQGWADLDRNAPLRPRSTLLFFTECPGCGLQILTNRDLGDPLHCRNCKTSFAADRVTSPALNELLDDVHRRMGRNVEPIAGRRSVVLIQALDPRDAPQVAEICGDMGFARLPDSHPLVANLYRDAVERGLIDDFPQGVWEKTAAPGSVAYANEATPDVEALLRMVTQAAAVHSVSTSYDPNDQTIMGLALRGDQAALEQRLRQELAEDPMNSDWLDSLIEVLISLKKLDEAREKALAAAESRPHEARRWTVLGRIEWDRGRTADAVAALERALSLDPVDRTALLVLSDCYRRLDEPEKAAMVALRLRSIGGAI